MADHKKNDYLIDAGYELHMKSSNVDNSEARKKVVPIRVIRLSRMGSGFVLGSNIAIRLCIA